jgi:hypothetical protein
MRKKTEERTLVKPLLLIILLSLLEPLLIFFGVLPKILSYSPGNLLFSFARLLVIAYVAYSRADETLETSALNGTVLGFTFSSLLCASGLVASYYYWKPILGISVTSSVSFISVLVFFIAENTVAGALLSVVVTWLTKRLRKKPRRPSRR